MAPCSSNIRAILLQLLMLHCTFISPGCAQQQQQQSSRFREGLPPPPGRFSGIRASLWEELRALPRLRLLGDSVVHSAGGAAGGGGVLGGGGGGLLQGEADESLALARIASEAAKRLEGLMADPRFPMLGVSRGEVLSALADGLERVQGALRGAMQASIELRLQQLLGQAEALRRTYTGPELRSRVRRLLGYQCTDAVFTPPGYKPATVVTSGASIIASGGDCQVTEGAAPVYGQATVTCNNPSVAVAYTQPRYQSAFISPLLFTSTVCRAQYRFGYAQSVTVQLWKPGELPSTNIKQALTSRQTTREFLQAGRAQLRADALDGYAGRAARPPQLRVNVTASPGPLLQRIAAALNRHTPRLASSLGLDAVAANAKQPSLADRLRTASGATVTGARAAGAIAGGLPRVRAQGGEGAEGAAAAEGADLAAGLLGGLSGVDGGLVEGLRQATAEVLKELGLEDEASLISNPGIGTAAEWDTARPLGSRGLLRPGGDGSSNDTASTNSTGSGGGGGAGEGGGGGGGAQAPGVRDWRDVLLAWESRGGGAGIGGLDASTPGSLGDLFDSALEAGLASTLYSSPVQQAAADGASSSSAGAGSSSGSAGVQAPEGSADWFGSLWSADEYEAESQAQTNFTQAEETVTSFDDLRKQADLASTGAGTDDGGPAPAPANGGAAGRRQQASAEAAGNAEAASQAGAQSLFMPNVMAQAVQRASDAAGSVLGNGGTEDPAGAAAGLGQGGFTADINSRMRQGLGAVMEGLSSAEADPRAKSTSDLFGALADEMEKMMRMQHLLLYDPPTGVPRTTPDPDSVL